MLASSFLDPVLGVDIHIELIPAPPAPPIPTPIPNPFTGIVFDPIGLAAGIAIGAMIGAVVGAKFQGPVLYWTAFPATNTGTEAKHVPGHILIPPGIAWAPFPKTPKPVIHPGEVPTPGLPVKPENDAVVVFGSKTVTVMGSNAVRLGDIALSCSEPVRLPSSVVMAVPKGAPILIGGPPSLDIMSAVMASLRTRFVSDSLHALVSRLRPSRFRNFLHRAVCFFTGHPVDVASGKVMTEAVDLSLPGPLPLVVERIYSSAFAIRKGVLGHGWSFSLDQAVWRERGKVVFQAEDGREIEFDTFAFPKHQIGVGQAVENVIEGLTLHCEKDGGWRIRDANGQEKLFTPVPGRTDGRAMIQRLQSRGGLHTIAFTYDTRGQLEQVRDAGGRIIVLRYDREGRVSELYVPKANGDGLVLHRRYHYDQDGDLIEVKDALGHAWRFAYVTHLLTQETDRNGLSFYFAYDGLGEDAYCVRTWGDGGIYHHIINYDKKNKVTFVTNSLGAVTQYHMNAIGQVVKIVRPHGGVTQYHYDPVTLKKTGEIDALGHETKYTLDGRGNPVRVTAPNGAETTIEYDAYAQPLTLRGPTGATWQWTYDSHGRQQWLRDPEGHHTRYIHEGALPTAIIDAAGARTSFEYDRAGNLVAQRSPNGAVMHWHYDALGRVTQVNDALGNVRRRHYDAEGRVIRVEEPDGNVRELAYDRERSVIRVRDKLGDVSMTYWGLGLLASRSMAGTTVVYAYDTEGQLVGTINEKGLRHTLQRDKQGDVVRERGFDGIERQFLRDELGRIHTIVRPDGKLSKYAYDVMHRLTHVQHADGSELRFGYRVDGALAEAETPDTRVKFEHDGLGRVVREWQGDEWVATRYDHAGRSIAVTSSLGANQEIRRNAMGDVEWIGVHGGAQPLAWQAAFQRDLHGFSTEQHWSGAARSQWSRDRLGRPHQHWVGAGDQPTRWRQYTWSVDERLTTIEEAWRGKLEFQHDARGYLVGVVQMDGTLVHRVADEAGNWFERLDRMDRSYGETGQLLERRTAAGVTSYAYEAHGNLARKREPGGGEWAYRWDAEGNLAEVERPDGKVVSCKYDAFGRRVEKRFEGKVTRWIWDGNVPLHEWTEPLVAANDGGAANTPPPAQDGPGIVTWLFEPGTFFPLARIDPTGAYSIAVDHIGTPLAMFDAAGTGVWQATLDSHGVATVDGDRSLCPFRFAGQYEDAETGLYYNRFRYYDPDTGQYTSQDPLGIRGGLAVYAYVADPLTTVDALGLITGPPYDFAELMRAAQNDLDFSTARDGAVFWSGTPRMRDAQAWARANGKTTVEMTTGGRVLDSLNLFESSSGLTGEQAAAVWDAASLRFAQGASGEVNVFSTGARKINAWGNIRTWWRIERPALNANPNVTSIVRRRRDGTPCQ